MLIKAIVHLFCGRSLEKQTRKTNTLIQKVEQKEKVAVERLTAKADDYRTRVIAYKKKRDVELKEFIEFMNQQLGLAEVYANHLGDFQDKMFVCLESWANTSVTNQKIQLISEKISTKYHMLNFISALQVELNKLTQIDERSNWFNIIKDRPILIKSNLIERTMHQVSKQQKSNNHSIRHDLNRLNSHSIKIRTEIADLRHERERLISSSNELIEKHKAHKAELKNQYTKCNELFREIKTRFSHNFGSATTGNSLADSWIYEIEGSVTIPKLFSTHKKTFDIFKEVKNDINYLEEKFKIIRFKIDEDHQNKEFSNLTEDKAERDRLFHEKKEARRKLGDIITARDLIYKRGNEVKEMLGKFDSLHPDESIRHIVEIFRMEEGLDIYQAIGVSTQEDRQKHFERKNNTRK